MDEKEILKYYNGIKQLDKEEDIMNLLPSPDFPSFIPIMNGLIDELNKDVEELNDLLNLEQNNEEIKALHQEIELYKFKLKICKERITIFKNQDEQLRIFSSSSSKNIIFAKSSKGNILIENDLKDIPEEYYLNIIDNISKLQEGIYESNTSKGRKLSNNKNLNGLHEIKSFKIRIIYRILDYNTIYIILAKMKKSNNDKKDINEVIQRKNQTNKEYEDLKIKIQDEQLKSQLIAEHNELIEKLRETLKSRQRWKNE